MKTKLILLSAAVMSVTSFISCKKENQVSLKSKPHFFASSSRLDTLLANPNDSADERMNDNLYMLANAFASFSDNSELMSLVYEAANDSTSQTDGEVEFSVVAEQDSRFYTYMNSYLKTNYFPDEDESFDSYEFIVSDMVYKSVSYYPEIYIPNIRSCNASLKPIICIGAEVNNNDEIIGYKRNADNSISQVLISESTALSSSEPIIIFTNGTGAVDAQSSSTNINDTTTVQAANEYRDFHWVAWRIKGSAYRYENIGDSEIRYVVTAHDNSQYLTSGSEGFPFGESNGKVGKATHSEVTNSTWVIPTSNWNSLLNTPMSPSSANTYKYFYITTYEHDWFVSTKTTKYCFDNSLFGIGKTHLVRMKYHNEWYINDICKLNHLYYFPGVNYVKSYISTKMDFEIKRSQ